ncbi:hypothetical protein [Vibrio diazotrophicus]|uniref:hypothetical protein n=1 Tax=Vibrio diazotrophicus TaxID=685 RepID=UPI000C9E0DA9|nr:hypothetical protein [Vibrio diazotrophicus]PNH92987.1 hypothetical protein C1M59_07185 [Vibrio diazotrophicus]
MKKNKTSLIISTVLILSGCSTLDSSSTFDDVASSVKERHNYVQVVAKEIMPDTKAVTGADVVKSSLFYVGNFAKEANADVKGSYVDMSVTTFKSYDRFDNVTVSNESNPIVDYRPVAETCTEHCTVTQWFQFPLSEEKISQFTGDEVEFTLASKTDKNVVQFSVPKAYFEAVKNEAAYAMSKQPQQVVPVTTLPAEIKSQSQDMVQYWFNEGTAEEQKQFADWAFSQRTSVTNMIKTDSKPVEMMAYWYDKASKAEKSEILAWLIRQE